ncbi:hypothetical protein, conserved [Leishmania tarentolae]|uniref:cDENN domain-containing protein n=1 Tax=Leishmania tarentolae TaxID=5689 RepID=A0A640K7X5_LEITA|nr:hypothetical protein, conserved [Leishmania tarentolae]
MLGGTVGGGGDGVPLITRLLLLRATVRFNLSPATPSTSSACERALMLPKLSIVSHYAQGPPLTSTSSPRPATATPQEAVQFLEAHPSLQGFLSSLAADRLAQQVKLRRLQTDVVRTSVKLARAAALTSSAEAAPAARGDSSRSMESSQLHGVVAAATANFTEDVAWCSTITPHNPQLNPWSLLPVSAEGCYLVLPSSQYVQWCEQQAMRCCSGERAAVSVEPDVCGGPMRYNDVVHYAGAAEDGGYVHGYTFVLEGDVFNGGSGTDNAATAAEEASVHSQRSDAALRDNSDEDASVLLWCVLSDAPVFNFMRTLTHEAVAVMSHIAQQMYRKHVVPAGSASASTPFPRDIYTALLDGALEAEVILPLAKELLHVGSASSRTLPGATFTVPLASSISRPLTFCRPLDLLYPYADVPLSILLLSFNGDALRVLQSLLMQEERVVVLGATPQHASACVVSLLALLSPLVWVSPLVPYLPPHLAAVTGLLRTLLKPPSEPLAALPASQRMESSGFLVGSTAAIQPYLVLLASASPGEAGVTVTGCGASGKRALRVWIADARTGCVGVCPQEPVALFLQADSPPSANPSDGSVATATASSTAVNAWGTRTHVNLRRITSHSFGGDGGRSRTNLYDAARRSLRNVAMSNVLEATPLDLLPAFSEDLRDQLHRVASVDQRRFFRHSLEAVAQHTQARVKDLESLAERLKRGLGQAIIAADADSSVCFDSTLNDTFENRSIGSDAQEGNDGLTVTRAGDDDGDDTASLRAITEVLAQPFSKFFAGGPMPLATSFPAVPAPQFPTLSLSDVWQVQAAVFDYMVSRFMGAYRRGLSRTLLGNRGTGGSGQSRGPAIDTSVFLVPGMDQHHALAERVAHTHMFKQFECVVLAAEQAGLRRVFSGAALARGGKAAGPRSHHTGEQAHPLLANVRYLALFSLLCSRARLHYPELYADMASVDVVGLVYSSVVTRWFANRSGPSSSVTAPRAIRLLAGGYTGAGESAVAGASRAAHSGSGSGVYHNSNGSRGGSGGGSGGSGLLGFVSKIAKVMKQAHGGNGSLRGLRTAYLPAAIACLHTFSAPLLSQLPVARQSPAVMSHVENTVMESNRSEAGCAASDRHGRHLHRHRNTQAFLKTCMPPPQRIKWGRQQEQQQRIALDTEFTLHDCVNVVRVEGLGSDGYNIPDVGVYIRERAYMSERGTGSEMASTSAAAQQRARSLQAMSEASLYMCHALPLDIVHRFDAYESLLCPVAPGSGEGSSTSAGGDALSAASAAAYMRVGLLCPSCMNVWCEVKSRATRTASEQSASRGVKSPAPAALYPASSVESRPLPPSRPGKLAETSIPQGSGYSFSAPPQATAPPSSVWCAFTSGAPQDYPSVNPVMPSGHPGGDAQRYQAPPVSTPMASPTSRDRDVWDSWGVQTPSVMTRVQPASVQGPEAERAQAQIGGSGSESGLWSTGAPLGPPMMPGRMGTAPPCINVALSTTSAAIVTPTTRAVMDDLFAGMPTHSTTDAAATGAVNPQQSQRPAASRPHALDDYF